MPKYHYFLTAVLLSLSLGQRVCCEPIKNEINASPLELLAPGENLATLSQQQQIEKQQMTMLCQAALNKSPDVQLTLKKLIPSGDPAKTLKLIEAVFQRSYEGQSSGNTIGPSFGPYGGSYTTPVLHDSSYYNFSKLLHNQEFVENANAKISATELRNFYEAFRETTKNIIGYYRDYKTQCKKLVRANEDFEELKKLIADAKDMDAAKQIEVQYSLKKQQGEIVGIGKDLERFRKLLTEQTSDDAVKNLDKSIQTESQEISAESDQLQSLFEAALQNSPDINFVLAKLAPNADLSKTATILMKQIGYPVVSLTDPHLEPEYPQIANAEKIPTYKLPATGSNFGITGSIRTTSDPTYVTQNLNFNVFSQIIDKAENNRATKSSPSQAERIMLYNMIRNTGKQVIADYREYKIQRKKQFTSKADFDETLLNKYRQLLIDLAGSDAVDKLDQQLDEEFISSSAPVNQSL